MSLNEWLRLLYWTCPVTTVIVDNTMFLHTCFAYHMNVLTTYDKTESTDTDG